KVIEDLAGDDRAHYGVSTGFGALATVHIAPERRAQLQRSLIRSHAAGSGPEVEREVVRAMALLRLSTLATGRTGVRPETALAYARRLLTAADVAAAMSVEALLGTDAVFAADLQGLRPHPGQAASAANLRALLAGSGVMASHRGPECTRVQDAYSLRCAPQV